MIKIHYVKSKSFINGSFIYVNPRNNAFDFNLVHDI